MYLQKPIKEYLEDLAAKKPAPGGGSAAALTGGLGIALLEMAANFTAGNKKYKDVEEAVNIHLTALKKIREDFAAFIDEDAKVYEAICAAFKAKDEKIIDKALKEGYYISLKMCELARSGMKISAELSEKSNPNLISDVGCGAEILKACFDASIFNSEINLKGIKDAVFKEKERLVIHTLKKDISDLHKKTISKVNERMA